MTICDKCGIDMEDKNRVKQKTMDADLVGIAIDLTESTHKEVERVEDVFGKRKFDLCFVCFIRAFGIKPKGDKYDI